MLIGILRYYNPLRLLLTFLPISRFADVFKHYVSQPSTKIRDIINSILKGWANYFRYSNSSKAFRAIYFWLNKKVRRYLNAETAFWNKNSQVK
ncbi:group II intron maturase-specific domain-containing protein [Arachidicoccus rhizosphaerae]|uniref:group II intron maturase-specific domain-containing protein n=1 Tax=Arachidicoccus rhizosphaerae TaxID=551991 RepID=UPI000B87A097